LQITYCDFCLCPIKINAHIWKEITENVSPNQSEVYSYTTAPVVWEICDDCHKGIKDLFTHKAVAMNRILLSIEEMYRLSEAQEKKGKHEKGKEGKNKTELDKAPSNED
jgi:hypothetical protein